MTVITFDTLKYAKKLVEAGVPQRQAEGQAEALAGVIDDQLATKRDLFDLEARLEMQLLKKLGSLMVVSIGISTAILGILIAVHP